MLCAVVLEFDAQFGLKPCFITFLVVLELAVGLLDRFVHNGS